MLHWRLLADFLCVCLDCFLSFYVVCSHSCTRSLFHFWTYRIKRNIQTHIKLRFNCCPCHFCALFRGIFFYLLFIIYLQVEYNLIIRLVNTIKLEIKDRLCERAHIEAAEAAAACDNASRWWQMEQANPLELNEASTRWRISSADAAGSLRLTSAAAVKSASIIHSAWSLPMVRY